MIITIKEKINLLEKVRTSLFQDLEIGCYLWGICHTIQKHTVSSVSAIEDNIPELLKYKPVYAGKYWYSMNKAGHEKRIEVINKTISDLENLLPKKEIEKIYFKCNPENIFLIKSKENDNIYYNSNDEEISLYFHKFFIDENPDLFIIKTKDDLLNNSMNDELYELQECCKKSIPSKKNDKGYYTFAYRYDKIEIVYFTKKQLLLTGSNIKVRFDSEEQAIMFLYKINLPENKELRNYFINILKD